MRRVLRQVHRRRGTVLKDGDRPEPETWGVVQVVEGGGGGGSSGGGVVVVVMQGMVVVVVEGSAEPGEHTHNTRYSTVDGAMETGQREARRIAHLLKAKC